MFEDNDDDDDDGLLKKKHHLLPLLTTGADQLDHGISTFVTTLVALPAEEAMLLEKLTFFG